MDLFGKEMSIWFLRNAGRLKEHAEETHANFKGVVLTKVTHTWAKMGQNHHNTKQASGLRHFVEEGQQCESTTLLKKTH
jgi:hypothetical protein